MSVSFGFVHPERLTLSKEVQFWNIADIVVSDEVSNPDRSRLVRLVHPSNMSYMVVTWDVSNEERSRLVNAEQR